MEHTEIAPLARRLAEENNVDWRRLRGSGERGRIVERDVLEFLARVMAGEEDVDPTPEPLPTGMEAWPEEDVRAYEREQEVEGIPPVGVSTVEDEIFLLDGDAEDHSTSSGGSGRTNGEGSAELEPDLLDTGSDALPDFEDDDLLVAGDDEPATGAAPPRRPTYLASEVPDVTGEEPSSEEEDGPVASGGGAAGALPDLFDDRPIVPHAAVGPVFEETALGISTKVSPGPVLEEGEREGVEEGRERFEPADVPVEEGRERFEPPDEPVAEARERFESRDEVVEGGFGAIAASPEVPDEVVRGEVQVRPELPLVSHGAVWRRQVDLTSLVAAQADVARDLGLDEPVPATAFLARAAAKALDDGSGLAMAVIGEHSLHTVPVDPSAVSFAELVRRSRAPDGAQHESAEPSLIVADLSELELDEAVLHLGAPVLCLGRVLIDSLTGGRRALLSLSGDAVGRDAARVLARAADLLETPIRLVL